MRGFFQKRKVLDFSVFTNCHLQKIVRYDFKDIANTSTVPLDDFYWRDDLPTDALRLRTIRTGTWDEHLTYSVEYQTNKDDNWQVLEDGLNSKASQELDCGRSALRLKAGEYVTAFRFHFEI